MRLEKTANGKPVAIMTKKEWQDIGKQAGWSDEIYNLIGIKKVAEQIIQIDEDIIEDRIRTGVSKNDWYYLQRALYSFLTAPPAKREKLKKWIKENENTYKIASSEFDKAINVLESTFVSQISNPWTNFYIKDGKMEKKDDNYKLYYTIPCADLDDIKRFTGYILYLSHFLIQSTSKYDSYLSWKIPNLLNDFCTLNDNLIIHFTDPNAKNAISEGVNEWMSRCGIKKVQRKYEFGRDTVEYSSDEKKMSHGDVIAYHTAKQVAEMAKSESDIKKLKDYCIKVFNENMRDTQRIRQSPQQVTEDRSLEGFKLCADKFREIMNGTGSTNDAINTMTRQIEGIKNQEIKLKISSIFQKFLSKLPKYKTIELGIFSEFPGFSAEIRPILTDAKNKGIGWSKNTP